MKTLNFKSKQNNTRLLVCSLLLAISSQAISQNKLAVLVASLNYHFVIPLAFVTGLAIFLLTLFIKQKNH